MISGVTVEILRRNVPHYHIVAPDVARRSLSICACYDCIYCTDRHCTRVLGKVEEDGLAVVAWNGTCDRAERKRSDEARSEEFKLIGEEVAA